MSFFHRLKTAFALALDSLRVHKLRTALTLLGVIIGVASVVLVGVAIEGLGNYSEMTTSRVFGTDSFLVAQMVQFGNLSRTERAARMRYNKPIRQADFEYLRQALGDRVFYSAYTTRTEDVKRENARFEGATILGASASLPEIRDVTLTEGRFFTELEEQNKRPVAVIGDELRATLFPGISPVGGKIKLRGVEFSVVGVQEKLGSSGSRTQQDNPVYIPISIYWKLFGGSRTGVAVFGKAKASSRMSLEESLDLTRVALRSRFHARPGKPDNFEALTPDTIRAFAQSILAMVSAVVIPVTAISLVVGGIVIMNIMLVSVTERTREIGIRKAIGARRGDILLQFLIEAILMACCGGTAGLLIGWAVTETASRVAEVPLAITWPYAALAIFVSSLVGVVSGWYPASQASKLDPVDALRAE
ncbi:MAG: ABC transporter permease [Candidatus Solibacter usitatus]|nr:ABC transporter permease [Candidatus Solibacter usitatus]